VISNINASPSLAAGENLPKLPDAQPPSPSPSPSLPEDRIRKLIAAPVASAAETGFLCDWKPEALASTM
jgi:hypothetical protein